MNDNNTHTYKAKAKNRFGNFYLKWWVFREKQTSLLKTGVQVNFLGKSGCSNKNIFTSPLQFKT